MVVGGGDTVSAVERPEAVLRAVLIGGTEFESRLEETGDTIWLSKTTQCRRHGWIGVPCSELDILIEIDGDRPGLVDGQVLEVGRKAGRYDGAERTRLVVRSRRQGMELARAVSLRWQETDVGLTLAVLDIVSTDTLWTASYRRLRSELVQDGLVRIVQWHARRYYRMVDTPDAVDEATAEVEAAAPPTITAANRAASRALYRLATEAGWRNLTARQQTRLGLTGQWHREDTLIAAYERLHGVRQTVGDWTLDASAGPEAHAIRARPWRADDEAEEVTP